MKHSKYHSWRLTILGVITSTVPLMAGTPSAHFRESATGTREETAKNVFEASYDVTFQSKFKAGEGRLDGDTRDNNNTTTLHSEIYYVHHILLSGDWSLGIGLDWDRYDFGDNRSFAPNTLQSYAAVLNLGYRFDKDGGLFIQSHPGLYFSHDVRGDAFDVPTDIFGIIPVVDGEFSIVAGVSFSLLRSYPVLPLGGILWRVNKNWDVEAFLPKPRVVFKPLANLQVWAGGEFNYSSFRMDTVEDSKLNATTVTYREVRIGGGIAYTGWKPLALEVGAGWAFRREFDFHRADMKASTEGAPYLTLSATARF